eukprot:7214967-Prymnesium_polylepis.1
MMCQRETRCRLRSQSIRSPGPAFHFFIFGISSPRVHDPWRSILFSFLSSAELPSNVSPAINQQPISNQQSTEQ